MPAALMIIDVQRAIDDPRWGDDRNNPQLEENLARLLAAWRAANAPIVHVRHASTEPESTYAPGGEGFGFKPEVQPREGEWIVEKSTNSAFIGTSLEERLREANIDALFIGGVITNNSVEATARMAGNLGFRTHVVRDACATFGRRDYSGRWRTADEMHDMSLANLDGEYATIVTSEEAIGML